MRNIKTLISLRVLSILCVIATQASSACLPLSQSTKHNKKSAILQKGLFKQRQVNRDVYIGHNYSIWHVNVNIYELQKQQWFNGIYNLIKVTAQQGHLLPYTENHNVLFDCTHWAAFCDFIASNPTKQLSVSKDNALYILAKMLPERAGYSVLFQYIYLLYVALLY
jgi:hypothetical protein